MLEVVIQPPSGDTTVLEVAFLICLPATIHLISAGGLLFAVVHVSGTGSPTRASVGPNIVTCAGETKIIITSSIKNCLEWKDKP